MMPKVTRRLGLALVGLCLLAGLLPDTAQAQSSLFDTYSIAGGALPVRATVQDAPARITLTWPLVTGSGGFKIYRKAREAGSFGSVYATVADGTTSYSDAGVVVGTGYEYEVKSVNKVGSLYLDSFVYSGIALPTLDSRGKLILLVDSTMTNALAGELQRFEQDLVGDGWTILRHDVTRQTTVSHNATTTEVATIKAIIQNDYTNDTANVKTVLLFGRVPIPYSGQINGDGHGATAREADSYYAVTGETWTDISVNSGTSGQYANVPGDSIYDQSYFTASNVKLGVGRVDLSAMPVFEVSETELLRRYLNKDHAFRHRLNASATAGSLSGGLVGSRTAFNVQTLFDANMVNTVPGLTLWYHVEALAIINWYFGSRNSFYPTFHVFTGVWGSGSIDYDLADGGQGMGRNYLASAGACLTWTCGQPNRYYHGMAMGETIGNCQRLGMANGSLYPSWANGNGYNQTHNNLLGDPTLRLQILAPPRALTITGSTLSWDASMEADVTGFQGYHVYRATSLAGPFTRLTATPVAATSWTDPSPLGGDVYQVRAIKLEISSTGSYYNNSQGAFATRDTVGIVPSFRRVIVPEGGTSFFQVKLSSAPSSNVTVTAAQAGGDPSLGVRSGASLTFTPGNWNVWQPVTLAAAWDSDNMDGNAAIRLSAPGLSHVTVGAVMADAEVLVSSDAVSVKEGGVGSFQVRLSRPPATSSVTVRSGLGTPPGAAPNLGVDIRVQSGDTLTFTQENWDQWQTVTLVANEVYNGGGQFKSSAPGYRTAYLFASCPERHAWLTPTVVSPAGSGTASPANNTSVVVGEPVRISATPAPGYRFAYWSAGGSSDYSMGFANPASADTTVTVYYFDNTQLQANFVLENQSVLTNTIERESLWVGVPQGGTSTFRVRLMAPPVSNVTVSAGPFSGTSSGTYSDQDITVQSGALTFTPTNWNVWQPITLAASSKQTAGGIGKAFIGIGGGGLRSATVCAYEIDPNVMVSVGFGVGGLSVTPEGKTAAIKGAPLAIRAVANTGYEFAGWRVVGGSATLADAHAPCTTITPDSSASVLAEFTLVGQRGAVLACAITQPGNTAVNTGTNLTITATAAALLPGRTLRKVEFFRDGVLLGEALSAPYTCIWTNVPAGSFEVMARATDSQGETGDSATIWVSATSDGQWPGVVAVGGDEVYNYVTNSVLYRVHTFTTSGSSSFSVRGARGDSQVEYLLVAGGGSGGGGSYENGGGGAGGMLTGTASVAQGEYVVQVGAGGVSGTNSSANGGNSALATLAVAIGGGAGSAGTGTAGSGGSGGGGNGYGLGTAGQGHDGAAGRSGSTPFWGGCGGGAGSTASVQIGGSGAPSSITGSNVTYAAGGNGGSRDAPSTGASAAANTGNGGGGAGNVGGVVYIGGNGGSGIVVMRYALTATQRSFPVLYHANGATGGTVPAAQLQTYGVPLTLAANSGTLVRAGYTFAGWNSAANGSGTDYAPGASYAGNAPVTLFAKWTASSYEVSYDANGATGGTAPATQTKSHAVVLTLAANTGNLVRAGYAFAGWNTAANGAGTDYVPGTPYTANAAMTLYAKWTFFGYQPPAITSTWADPVVVTQPGGTTVHVAASDPDGRPLDYAWSQISGPGTVAFTSPYSSASSVTFSRPGTYVLRITVGNVRGEFAVGWLTVSVAGIVTDVASLAVPEGGTNSFRLKLASQPDTDVTVTAANASGDADITVQYGASRTFTTANWNDWQTVTLVAAQDDADVADGSAAIVLSGVGIAVGTAVMATEVDNDTTLIINAGPGGAVSPVGQRIVTKGVAAPITATPNSGYSFAQWVVTVGSASFADPRAANTTITVTEPVTIRANFVDDANPGNTETWTWGYNNYGQLGDGGIANSLWPKAISFAGADTIAGGDGHTIARKPDGSVWAWGLNGNGQLGNGTITQSNSSVRVAISNVSVVAAGSSHSAAVKTDGSVWTWGANGSGQIGNGESGSGKLNPVQVPGLTGVTNIAAGGRHAMALKTNGTVWGWGLNTSGQLGDGTKTTRAVPAQVPGLVGVTNITGGSALTFAVKPNGTLWSWGDGNAVGGAQHSSPAQIASGVVATAAGTYHALALKTNGTVVAWGYNSSGQLGDGTTTAADALNPVTVLGMSGVIAVGAGAQHSLAVKSDGTVWAWGNNFRGQLGNGNYANTSTPVQVSGGLSGVIAVAGGYYHSVALENDGTVWAWGYNVYGQLGDGTNWDRTTPVKILSGARAIAAGSYHSVALKNDGTVWAWGNNGNGQLGDGTTVNKSSPTQVRLPDGTPLSDVVAISVNNESSASYAVKSDGTVWAWGDNSNGQLGLGYLNLDRTIPVQVPGLVGVTNVAAGSAYTVAVKTNGTVWAWGQNINGQLGDNTTFAKSSPVWVSGISNVTAVAGSSYHTVAVKTDGSVWSWGYNSNGQLGDGSTITRLTPVQVKMEDGTALSDVTAVVAGGYHTVALKSDGSVWAWGDNYYGQLGDGTNVTRLTPVQVMLADGTALSDVIAIAAGAYHTLAMKSDGSVWAWGYNYYGQLGMGGTDSNPHPTPVQVVAADGMPLSGAIAIGAGGAGGYHSLALLQKQVYVRVVIDKAYVAVPEGGNAGIQVKLSAAPAATVTVTALRVKGDTDITGSSLTFTSGNWNTNQTLTFTAAEDADMENGSAVFILSGSAGVDFGATVLANEVDNDILLTVNATPGGTVSPAGAGPATVLAATPITAVPAPRYIFANWSVVSGAALIADPYATNTTVLLLGAAGVQANFVPLGENRPPVIGVEATADPAETRLPSAVTTVSVTASDPDGDTLTYAWRQVAGQGAATFATPAAAQSLVTFNAAGIYGLRVTVSDGRGGIVSSDVAVTVNRMLATPTITRQPFNLLVCLGELAGFVVVATGDDLSYQWYRNGVEIFSGTGAGYTTPAATMADNGAKFKVRVSNASGSVMSSEATLTVLNTAPGTGLTGKYYDNMDFTGLYQTKEEYVYQGEDSRCSTFSKRWIGQVRPQFTETNWFYVRAGSDVRLWVNGVLLV